MTTNPFDQASRYTARIDSEDFLRWLLGPAAVGLTLRQWLDTRTVPFPGEPDRTCDTVASLARDDTEAEPWALAVEFQCRPEADMFGRLLEYVARLWRMLRPPLEATGRFQLAASVVNLTGAGQTSRDMQLHEGGPRTCLRVVERNLAEEDAKSALAAIEAGRVGRWLLAWIPLMHGSRDSNIISAWKALALTEPDARKRSDYGGLALVFAELAGCQAEWKRELEGWNLEQSQQVLEWQAIAEKRGEARGKAEGKAEALLRQLQHRFKEKISAELASMIKATTDCGQLDTWLDAVLDVHSLDEFVRLVKPGTNGTSHR